MVYVIVPYLPHFWAIYLKHSNSFKRIIEKFDLEIELTEEFLNTLYSQIINELVVNQIDDTTKNDGDLINKDVCAINIGSNKVIEKIGFEFIEIRESNEQKENLYILR